MACASTSMALQSLRWDVFCRVVDNYGDVGVSWRLAAQLAARGARVRLFVDPGEAGARSVLRWLAPQGHAGVLVCDVPGPLDAYAAPDVVVAAFGCALPEAVLAAMARAGAAGGRVDWINLEYLSAEAYAARSHGLASPVHGGAGGVHKWFFFPGFTPDTGGLLREDGLIERRAAFDRARWLGAQDFAWRGETLSVVFCYEPALLGAWIAAQAQRPSLLLVAAGRSHDAVRAAVAALPAGWNRAGQVRIEYLAHLPQEEFDRLLWSADFSLVRGEDSLVRALWAGAAFAWQAYPQDDGAHAAKVDAFLDWLAAPASLRRFSRAWNGLEPGPLPPAELGDWAAAVQAGRSRLLAQDDLVTRLLRFISEKRYNVEFPIDRAGSKERPQNS